MSLRLINPPSVLPVTLAEAKTHLRVGHSEDDALITLMIESAAAVAEQQMNRALMAQTWELIIDAFPVAEIKLPRPRVLSIEQVSYIDPEGVEQTLAADAYTLDADLAPGWLLPALGTTWPSTRDQANAVRVRFVAGYGSDAAAVPSNVQAWLLMHVGAAYRNREAFAAGVSMAELPGGFVDRLLDAEKVYW